jgi:hypothetical protein
MWLTIFSEKVRNTNNESANTKSYTRRCCIFSKSHTYSRSCPCKKGIWEVVLGGTKEECEVFLHHLSITNIPHLYHYSFYIIAPQKVLTELSDEGITSFQLYQPKANQGDADAQLGGVFLLLKRLPAINDGIIILSL